MSDRCRPAPGPDGAPFLAIQAISRHFLAIYELNDLRILQEVFIRAYERSAQRYTVMRGAVGDPDRFRVRYRQLIADQVAEIDRSRCDRREVVACLRQWAESIGRFSIGSRLRRGYRDEAVDVLRVVVGGEVDDIVG